MELQPTDHSNSNTSMCSPPLANHNHYDGKFVEQAVDLYACTAIEYEQKDDAHSVRFICDEKEGWTPVIRKSSQDKVPTCLPRPTADHHMFCKPAIVWFYSAGETSDSDCSLQIPAGGVIFVTYLTVENQAMGYN